MICCLKNKRCDLKKICFINSSKKGEKLSKLISITTTIHRSSFVKKIQFHATGFDRSRISFHDRMNLKGLGFDSELAPCSKDFKASLHELADPKDFRI